MLVRIWDNRKSYSLLGMQNGADTFEDSLVVPCKTKHSYHIIQKLYSLIFTQMNVKLMSHINLHIDFYSNFIHNFPNFKATKVSFSKLMDKQTVVHSHSGILSSAKKK